MKFKNYFIAIIPILLCLGTKAQNENNIWYFGNHAGLDFSTNPPTTLTNSAMYSSEGCSTVSDAIGNLLFYTDGITVWNKSHLMMQNGNGLMGHPSAAQSGLVVKQPGNPNLFYIFTVDVAGGTNGLRYSVIDMNLAAGMGSVTVKNTLLYTPCTEKLTAVKSSNGLDFWIVTHEWGSANFRSYKLNSTGVNTVCAISNAGTMHGGNNIQNAVGCMKISPNGQKLGLAISNMPYNLVELFDFNNFNGVVSNQLTLTTNGFVYGVEFSSNSSKFYATQINMGWAPCLKQWDLSNNNNASIANSVQDFYGNQFTQNYGMQLAPNGKIYIASYNSHSLSVIHHPDLPGAACGFSLFAQPLGTANALIGLPSFLSMPYSYNTFSSKLINPDCIGLVEFHSPLQINQILNNSTVAGYSVTGLNWTFGDPTSSSNTSNLYNPTHTYLATGDYTVRLIINYSHQVNNDTITHVVRILNTKPQFNLLSNSPICERENLFLSVSNNTTINNIQWVGPMGFSSPQRSHTITNTTPNNSGLYKFYGMYGSNCFIKDSIQIQINHIPTITVQNATVCLNQNIKLFGGGADYYFWQGANGDTCKKKDFHFASVQLTNAGNYTLTGTMVNGCSASATMNLYVSELPLMNVQILPPKQKCLNDVITFITPENLSASWQGPRQFFTTKNQISFWANSLDVSGNYSLSLKNELGCETKTIIPIIINNLPEIILSSLPKPDCEPLNLNIEVLNKEKNLKVMWETDGEKTEGYYLKHRYNKTGNQSIIAKLNDKGSGCSNSFTYMVNVLPKPKAEFQINPLIIREGLDEINLLPDSKYMNSNEYSWNISNAEPIESIYNPKFKIENAGQYLISLTIKNKYGCLDTSAQLINIKPNISIYAPDVFTPNNDNKNEVFAPVIYGANAIRLCVFNRWGNKLFESSSLPIEWDGKFQNQICKEDSYYWVLDYEAENNIGKQKSGVVLLMK